jgi:hypothetical protein
VPRKGLSTALHSGLLGGLAEDLAGGEIGEWVERATAGRETGGAFHFVWTYLVE